MITNEFEIKKSRFITYLYKLDNEEAIDEIIDNIKKEHKKARHVVYVYKINNTGKINDDGEPKGTAGMPIFNVIEKNNLNNILIIVVRYFGGINYGQLSHPYMTTGKSIALTRWTLVGKVMSLLFNMLSKLVITFLPRSKSLNFMAIVTICRDFGRGSLEVLGRGQPPGRHSPQALSALPCLADLQGCLSGLLPKSAEP